MVASVNGVTLCHGGRDNSISKSSMNFGNCGSEVDMAQTAADLHRQFFEAHLNIKDRLIHSLELVIDEQEGRISELRTTIKRETGRLSPLTVSDGKMMRGISYLSVEFGELSEENLQLKEALLASEMENRRLQIRLSQSVTNFAQLPLLMDDTTQTDADAGSYEDDSSSSLGRGLSPLGNKNISDDDDDTDEDDGDNASMTTASSMVPCDPGYDTASSKSSSSSSTADFQQENIQLKTQIAQLEEAASRHDEALAKIRLASEDAVNRLLQRYAEEVSLRKALHDALVQLRGNIRVFCRLRPSSLLLTASPSVQHDALDCDAVTVTAETGTVRRFLFDRVFGPTADQTDLYAEVSPLIMSCLDGHNVCIFAYGQTGSGKTYTMDGPESNPGIGHRALCHIFEFLEQQREKLEFSIQVSVIEIYNEKIRDLLDQSNQHKLGLHLEKDGKQRITNLSRHAVDSVATVQQILATGRKNRSVAATALNDQSSRSHAIVMIEIETRDRHSGTKCVGRLNLIDLAGSERVAKSQVSGTQLKEAQFINKSLSELGNVVAALRRKQQHVPFRNCLLTRILEDSLDGDSKTLMIVQVATEQHVVQESVSSLNFAEKISNVTRRQTTSVKSGGTVSLKRQ